MYIYIYIERERYYNNNVTTTHILFSVIIIISISSSIMYATDAVFERLVCKMVVVCVVM